MTGNRNNLLSFKDFGAIEEHPVRRDLLPVLVGVVIVVMLAAVALAIM